MAFVISWTVVVQSHEVLTWGVVRKSLRAPPIEEAWVAPPAAMAADCPSPCSPSAPPLFPSSVDKTYSITIRK